MYRSGLLFLLFAITVGGLFTWLNSTWLSFRGFELIHKEKQIDYYISDFTLLNTYPDGQMRYLLTAQNLVHQQSTEASEIFSPVLQSRDIDNSIISITSKTARQDKKDDPIQLFGKVEVVKKSPQKAQSFKLLTTDLIYNPIKKELSSDTKVLFTSDMGEMQGVGFNTKLDEQELRIHNDAQADFTPAN